MDGRAPWIPSLENCLTAEPKVVLDESTLPRLTDTFPSPFWKYFDQRLCDLYLMLAREKAKSTCPISKHSSMHPHTPTHPHALFRVT